MRKITDKENKIVESIMQCFIKWIINKKIKIFLVEVAYVLNYYYVREAGIKMDNWVLISMKRKSEISQIVSKFEEETNMKFTLYPLIFEYKNFLENKN